MNNEETKQHLAELLDSIEATYEDFGDILNRCADRETVERFAEHHGITLDDYGINEENLENLDDDAARDDVCGELEGVAMDAMHDYPLSVDDSHIWFALGGPNISANITGWSVSEDGGSMAVTAHDITLKGRWGGASVDRDVWRGSFLFDQIAEMFEQNLLMKFGAL